MMKTILLVDDEESIRESLAKVLRAEGYDIVLAENGQKAIEVILQGSIALVLLDLGLPVKDGWATLQWLTEANPLLPVIVITGRWRQSERAEFAGADVLMDKPLNVPTLLQNIRELLQESAEATACRIQERRHNFLHVPCDTNEFRKGMQKRYTTPYQFNVPSETEHY